MHLPLNIASVPSTAGKILKKYGHKVYVLNLEKSKIQSDDEVILFPNLKGGGILIKLLRWLLKAIYFLYFVLKADIVHYHQDTFIHKPLLEAFLLKILRKKAIVQFHGSEIRIPEIAFKNNIYFK